MKKIFVPEFDKAKKRSIYSKEDVNPLERFVYNNEPATQYDAWRESLQEVIDWIINEI